MAQVGGLAGGKAPFKPQHPQEVRELVQLLNAHTKRGKGGGKGGFSVKKATFTLPTGRTVDSWRLQDWDYKKPYLPTYARGLFTCQNKDGNQEIVVRGYDKFFNHGEVRNTEWRNVENNTRGPYELSVKENGCIIFLAGMDDGSLLVCSKHSTGARTDISVSHAVVGEQWAERQLGALGKTKEDLARKLREMNATAVAELCDDRFEEHVLAYPPETSGLYLHGINLNLPEFATYPGYEVGKFAEQWGFKKTMYVMENDIVQVKKFLDNVAETGVYANRETEGFVIRCQAHENPAAPWHDWFFKYKFEEPYLMYRQWRECTKAMIAGKAPKYKKHQKITEKYLTFARRRFQEQPGLTKQYQNNHGIISLRNQFLASEGVTGADVIQAEIAGGEYKPARDVTMNVVLIPIATIGCGKTTVALALKNLFNWGHVQNDNIEGQKNRPRRFAQALANGLIQYPVMIADRNNHQKRERRQLMQDVSSMLPEVKFVALHYVHDRGNYDEIRKAMRERVFSRGDNHQTIHASTDAGKVEGIMDGFLQRFEPCDPDSEPDNGFDLVIDLDVTANSRDNLETVISQLNAEFPKLFDDMPSSNDLDSATSDALNVKPGLKHTLNFGSDKKRDRGGAPAEQQKERQRQKQPKPRKMEYFCAKLHEGRVLRILEAVFRDLDSETARFYCQLKQMRRIQPEFHVTIIHRTAQTAHPEKWDHLCDLHAAAYEEAAAKNGPGEIDGSSLNLGMVQVQLERVVWNNRVMCIVARMLNASENGFDSVNPIAHVTVGTADQSIKPKESNDLLQKWMEEGTGGPTGIRDVVVKGSVVLDGSVRGVLQRL
ncbi:RNA ligase-domain-containing protein [Lineolata rhizophorae]|uniref:tRNA ligase n=1 Tax=Lineolata rhizophorae TaxID=578093 RepID=A0A6A6NL57_9PEZI|nr:RNA ligase-domain-containing protein [Lineolata rhizophorae]